MRWPFGSTTSSIVYGSRENEILSAEYFSQLATPEMPVKFTDRVCEFIIATQHAGAASDSSVALVVDIDLSGFGLPWEKYLADSDALRHEAGSVGDEQYFQGKLRFLSELQQWPSLFQTEHFRDRLEAVAQANIARYTAELRAQGLAVQALFAEHSQQASDVIHQGDGFHVGQFARIQKDPIAIRTGIQRDVRLLLVLDVVHRRAATGTGNIPHVVVLRSYGCTALVQDRI